MKIAVWKTGHEIADTVAEAVHGGIDASRLFRITDIREGIGWGDAHICYGILRGASDVYNNATASGKPWFNIDRGYWKPGHYDGYYRISLNGTQQTTGLDKLEPDYERWDAFGLEILPFKSSQLMDANFPVLYCPATHDVAMFYHKQINIDPNSCGHKLMVRRKEMNLPLQTDLDACGMVVTFNSSVGWEALRQGIPVMSDKSHSIVGNYQNTVDSMSQMDIDSRRRLFAVMASLQLTLEEIRQGKIWEVMSRLLRISDTTTAKQSVAM